MRKKTPDLSPTDSHQAELRRLPSVTTLLAACAAAGVFQSESDASQVQLLRPILASMRAKVLRGETCPSLEAAVELVRGEKLRGENRQIRRVLNATGIALHTNLGRAPLPHAAMGRITELVTGYCNLELDLETGKRGARAPGLSDTLCSITGAEAALVVNNGAAAIFLVLNALAVGKEVVISRGELVQIGGGFRVPDILTTSGAALREVGTTNITSIKDFARAVGSATGMLLKVHQSNFYLGGHTEAASVAELVALAKQLAVPLVYDLGSGGFVRWQGHDSASEPTVQEVIRAGVDLVCFSGDKLVGGPQAGIIVGRKQLIEQMAQHPLYRVLRPGRLTAVALQEVLRFYQTQASLEDGSTVKSAHLTLPAWSAIEVDHETHALRTAAFAVALGAAGLPVQIVDAVAATGGGAAPEKAIPTKLLKLIPANTSEFLARLRQAPTPVIARVEKDAVLLDLRTVEKSDEPTLIAALQASWE